MRREAAAVAAAVIAVGMGASTASAQQSTPEGLAFFHLADSGDGRISFESSESQGGVQVLTGVTITGEDGTATQAETLRIAGARETPDGVVFDSLEILNLTGTIETGAPGTTSGKAPGKGQTASSGPETVSIDRLVIERPNALLASAIAEAFSLEGVDEDADWGMLSDYAFETMAIEGFTVESSDGTVSFETLSLNGFTGEMLGGFAFQNLVGAGTSEGSDVSIALGSLTLNGLDTSGLDALAEVDFEDQGAVDQALLESGFSDPYRKHYDNYALEGLRIEVDGVIIGLQSLAGEVIERSGAIRMNDALQALTVEFDDSKDMGAEALAGLQMLGYDRIEVNGESVTSADGNADRVSTEEYSLRAEDALTLELDYDIGGMREYMAAAMAAGPNFYETMDPDAAMEVFGPLMIHSFELRLTDDSLVERALQAAADSQGSTPEIMRQQAIGFLSIGTMMAPPGAVQTLVSDAITAASSFLEEPGTLRVSINPSEPVSVADLATAFASEDYDSALTMMNIEVVAE